MKTVSIVVIEEVMSNAIFCVEIHDKMRDTVKINMNERDLDALEAQYKEYGTFKLQGKVFNPKSITVFKNPVQVLRNECELLVPDNYNVDDIPKVMTIHEFKKLHHEIWGN